MLHSIRLLAVPALLGLTGAVPPVGTPTVQFASATAAADENTGALLVSVELSETSLDEVSVPFTIAGTALEGVDYTIDASPLVIAVGELSTDITITLLDEALYELDETIELTLGSPTNATLGATTVHTSTVQNDDAQPTVNFSRRMSVNTETSGKFTIELALSEVSGLPVRVQYAMGGPAEENVDYIITQSPLIISAGELSGVLDVEIIDDGAPEGPEHFFVDMGNVIGGVTGTTARHRSLIHDDESQADGPVDPPNTPADVLLSDTPRLRFSLTQAPSASAPQTVVVTNPSDTPLTFKRVVPKGAHRSDFSISYSTPPPVVLGTGQSTSFDVVFQPQEGGGVRGAVLHVKQAPVPARELTVPVSGNAFGATGEEFVLNAGAEPYIDSDLEIWHSDYNVSGPGMGLSTTSAAIEGTEEDGLFQSIRSGASFGYRFALPNGTYDIVAHFAEHTARGIGERVFDVAVEGVVELDDLDIVAQVGDRYIAYSAPAIRCTLTDGELNIDFTSQIGGALISGLEVRSVPLVSASATLLDFGNVDEGSFVDLPLSLANVGLHVGVLDTVSFVHTSQSHTAGHDFHIEIDGQDYYGSHTSVFHSVYAPVPPAGQLDMVVTFAPSEHEVNELLLRLDGTIGRIDVVLRGTGDNSSWGFLHPVIHTGPALVVDYDSDGEERVQLLGAESHTHEVNHFLTLFEWSENDVVFSNGQDPVRQFNLGATPIKLTIHDDNQPASTASLVETVFVHPVDAVPGILAFYYQDDTLTPQQLLDAVPARGDFIERLPLFQTLNESGYVGGSPFQNNVMVRWVADFEVAQSAVYEFVMIGGSDTRVELNGNSISGPIQVAPGTHTLDLRFAVDTLGDLPLGLTVNVDGIPDGSFGIGSTHDEAAIVPVIHDMPSIGTDLGGNLITIDGFGFYPKNDVTIHWGTLDFDQSDLESYTAERLEFFSPPGTGTINVTVETPAGTTDVRQFTYSPTGPVPIAFTRLDNEFVTLSNPTVADWGPDGRFYVGLLEGEIVAITFDENYHATQVETYVGVSQLTNFDICGLAFDPWDDSTGPVKVYVAHGEHFQNGGGSFGGESLYTGQVSVLTGPDFDSPTALITRLPVSNHDHGINGMVFDNNGDLLIGVGGNTNAGVKWPLIGDVPESPLSGAIVKARLSLGGAFNGQLSYEETATGTPNNDQVFGEEVDLAPGTHVEVFAPGFRNAFDIAYTRESYVYATDNGPNGGYGPASTGPDTDAGPNHPQTSDELMLAEYGNYYGHPNRNRGRYFPREDIYRNVDEPSIPEEFSQRILNVASSTNGVVEYRSQAFNGQIQGWLLVQKWNSKPKRVELNGSNRSVVSLHDINPFVTGLDIQVGPGGAILTTNYTGNRIELLVPDDASVVGLTAHDIFPWRASAVGGASFVIGGENFGTLGDTAVTFDGIPAVLTEVTSRRIKGIVPVHPTADDDLIDIEVQVGLNVVLMEEAFVYLRPRGTHPGLWRRVKKMTEPQGEVSAVAIGGFMYVVGEGGATSGTTYRYDLLNNTWIDSLAQRPFAGNHNASEVWDGKWYLIGGLSAGEGKVQIYDPVADSWSLGADMPWAGGSVASALIGDKIYVAGGIVGSETVANTGIYDPVLDTWAPGGTMASMATKVNHAASGTDGEKLYVFGGRQGGNWPQPGFDTVQVYDPLTNTWDSSDMGGSSLTPMPQGRGGTGRAVFYRGEFYVFGGESDVTVFEESFAYDPVGNSWREAAPMLAARHGIYPVLFQNRVFVAGGGTSQGNSQSDKLEIFSRL